MTSDEPTTPEPRQHVWQTPLVVTAILLFCVKWLQYGLDLQVKTTLLILAFLFVPVTVGLLVLRMVLRIHRIKDRRRRRTIKVALLIMFALFVVYPAVRAAQGFAQRSRVEAIEDAEGHVSYGDLGWTENYFFRALLRQLRDVVGDDFLYKVTYVHLNAPSDATLERLSETLEDLDLIELTFSRSSEVTDEGLAHLQGLTDLTSLGLGGANISDAGLPHLAGFTKLTFLSFSGTNVTDDGVNQLQQKLPRCSMRLYP